jgi:hypothetical protein
MAYLYRHIRLDKNEPFYIGIGSDDKGQYKRAKNMVDRSVFWHKIVKKTGYQVEIMLDNLNWEEACQKEIEFIKLYGRIDLGKGCLVNLTDGGEGVLGFLFTDEQKIANSKRLKILYKKGLVNGFLGKNHSEESNNKNRISHLGRKHSDSTKEKMSLDRLGKKKSVEHKEKIGLSNLGKQHSDYSKQIISQKAKKRFSEGNHPSNKIVLDFSNGNTYQSLKEAHLSQNIYSYSYMKNMLNGSQKNKTAFMYLDDYYKLNNENNK